MFLNKIFRTSFLIMGIFGITNENVSAFPSYSLIHSLILSHSSYQIVLCLCTQCVILLWWKKAEEKYRCKFGSRFVQEISGRENSLAGGRSKYALLESKEIDFIPSTCVVVVGCGPHPVIRATLHDSFFTKLVSSILPKVFFPPQHSTNTQQKKVFSFFTLSFYLFFSISPYFLFFHCFLIIQ